MSDQPILDELLATASDAMRQLIAAAYDAGRAAGRSDAETIIRAKLERVLDDDSPGPRPKAPAKEKARDAWPSDRAPAGSVRPKLLTALKGNPFGVRPAIIAKTTGMNANTIRGGLNILRREGLAMKKYGAWMLVPQKNEAADANPEGESSAASKPGAKIGASD